jgi:hypothetical protein
MSFTNNVGSDVYLPSPSPSIPSTSLISNIGPLEEPISKLYVFNEDYEKYISKTNNTIQNQVIESNNILNREYTLLFIWFIIAIIILIITTVAILSNELNSFVLYPALGFFIFIVFYIFKNIYIYFNELTITI